MWWILFALLSLSASLIVWLACAVSGRLPEEMVSREPVRHLSFEPNGLLQPVPIRVQTEPYFRAES